MSGLQVSQARLRSCHPILDSSALLQARAQHRRQAVGQHPTGSPKLSLEFSATDLASLRPSVLFRWACRPGQPDSNACLGGTLAIGTRVAPGEWDCRKKRE